MTNHASLAELRFAALKERWMPAVRALIGEVVGAATPAGSELPAMLDYHLDTGGKRLRALLPLWVAEALGTDPERLVPFGAACEVLHNATLVHDDLQDGDRQRRGWDTVWVRHGEPRAINLGDAMFYYAVLLTARLDVSDSVRQGVARRLLVESLRVIDGQDREFLMRERSLSGARLPDEAEYTAMVEGKTSGLFALPMAGAAALCGADQAVVDGLTEAARHLGVLFQIQDDVLDLYGDKGRGLRGSDIAEGKRSVLVVHGLAVAAGEDRVRLVRVLDLPRDQTTPAHIDEVIALLERLGSLEHALDEIARRRALAAAAPGLEGSAALVELVESLGDLFLAPIRPLIEQRGWATPSALAAPASV